MNSIKKAAHAVLLPAFDGMKLSDAVKKYLDNGGHSILLGESREEYVNRQMTNQRKSSETPETFHQIINEATSYNTHLIVAVDQEIGGICRLHDLVRAFPPVEVLVDYDTNAFENLCFEMAKEAKAFGVNCFLAPILDLVTGENPWLAGRT